MWEKEFGFRLESDYRNGKTFARKGGQSIEVQLYESGQWIGRTATKEYVFYPNRKGLLLSKEIQPKKEIEPHIQQLLFDLENLKRQG
jgi:hypothetical protein